MDYTDLQTVRSAMGNDATSTSGSSSTNTALMARLITSASRWIDRLCTGKKNSSDDYFMLEDITDEIFPRAFIQADGTLVLYSHKPVLNSIDAMAWRYSPQYEWSAIDVSDVTALDIESETVRVPNMVAAPGYVQVKMSYNGGYAVSASPLALPADLVEAATVLTIRLYREDKSGLTDAIGIAELGTITYTKALPVRVQQMLIPYSRNVGW